MDQEIRGAISRWGWPANTPYRLLAERENRVYRLEPPAAEACVLRVHRKGYRTEAELDAELQWMAYVAKQGMSVPVPIPSKHGRFLEVVDDWQMDCLSWLDGRPLGKTGQPLQLNERLMTFRRIGETIAQLHQLTDTWTLPDGFVRPSWDLDGLLGEAPTWGCFWENPQLSPQQKQRLLAVREQAQHDLRAQAPHLDFGLIHADLVRENIFLKGDTVQLLDFDDSGFGYRLFEVATALLKNRNEADYPALEQALLSGYCSIRPLTTETLPLFMLLRACTYVGWISTRLNEPGGLQRSERLITTALALAETYLQEGL